MSVVELPFLAFSLKTSQASWLWAVGTGPLRECRTLIPPSGNLFLTPWSELCVPETYWKLFCKTLAGLSWPLLAQRSLLQPCLILQLVYLTQISECSSFHQMRMNYRQQSTRGFGYRGGMSTVCSANVFSLRSSWGWTWRQRVR